MWWGGWGVGSQIQPDPSSRTKLFCGQNAAAAKRQQVKGQQREGARGAGKGEGWRESIGKSRKRMVGRVIGMVGRCV